MVFLRERCFVDWNINSVGVLDLFIIMNSLFYFVHIFCHFFVFTRSKVSFNKHELSMDFFFFFNILKEEIWSEGTSILVPLSIWWHDDFSSTWLFERQCSIKIQTTSVFNKNTCTLVAMLLREEQWFSALCVILKQEYTKRSRVPSITRRHN